MVAQTIRDQTVRQLMDRQRSYHNHSHRQISDYGFIVQSSLSVSVHTFLFYYTKNESSTQGFTVFAKINRFFFKNAQIYFKKSLISFSKSDSISMLTFYMR